MNVKMRVTVGDWYPDEQIAALAHIDALTAGNERLRAELDSAEQRAGDARAGELHYARRAEAAESRLAEANAENERLRADASEADKASLYSAQREQAAEARVASAVGLLDYAANVMQGGAHQVWFQRFRAFRASAQPAAPAVRAPNPEAVARILADPDCAAPARVVDGDGRYIVGGVKP